MPLKCSLVASVVYKSMRLGSLGLLGVVLLLAPASCAANSAQQTASRPLPRQDEAQARLQFENVRLRAEIDMLRGAIAERDRREAELWRAQLGLIQRIDQLLELQKSAVSVASGPEVPTEYRSGPVNNESPQFVRAMVRAINRLELSSEQKRALIQMLYPPRQLDGNNPWNGGAPWGEWSDQKPRSQ